jgi:hypothetical protein
VCVCVCVYARARARVCTCVRFVPLAYRKGRPPSQRSTTALSCCPACCSHQIPCARTRRSAGAGMHRPRASGTAQHAPAGKIFASDERTHRGRAPTSRTRQQRRHLRQKVKCRVRGGTHPSTFSCASYCCAALNTIAQVKVFSVLIFVFLS